MTPQEMMDQSKISDERLLRLVTRCSGSAREIAQDSKSLVPILEVIARPMQVVNDDIVLEDEKTYIFALAVPFNESDEKRPMLRAIAADFRKKFIVPVAVILSSEAWAAQMEEDEVNKVQPRHHPNKREILLTMAMTLDRRVSVATAEVTRDSDEKMTVAEFSKPEAIENGGSGLLLEFYREYFNK